MNGYEWLIVLGLLSLLVGLAYRSLADGSRTARSLAAAYLLFYLWTLAAIGARQCLVSSWEEYQSIAAMFIGVGGIFVMVGLATDGESDSSNAAGLGAVGLGGVMIAFKEAAAPFTYSEDFRITDIELTFGWDLFVKSAGLVFLTLIVLLIAASKVQSRRRKRATDADAPA